ncbi:MAG: GAF domain-containing protein [Nitrospinota bacterium]
MESNHKITAFISTGEVITDLRLSLFFENLGWDVHYQPILSNALDKIRKDNFRVAIISVDKKDETELDLFSPFLEKLPNMMLILLGSSPKKILAVRNKFKFHQKVFSIQRSYLLSALDLLLLAINEQKVTADGEENEKQVLTNCSDELAQKISVQTAMFSFLEKNSLQSDQSFRALLQRYLDTTLTLFQASRGSIMLIEDHNQLSTWAATSNELIGDTISLSESSLFASAIKENRIVVVERSDRSDKKSVLITLPVRYESSVIGILNIEGKHDLRQFVEQEESILTLFTGVIVSSFMGAKARHERDLLKITNRNIGREKALKESILLMAVNNLKLPTLGIRGKVKMATQFIDNAIGKELTSNALTSLRGVTKMIDNILEIASVQEKGIKVNKSNFDLRVLLEKVLEDSKDINQIDNNKIALSVAEGNFIIESDPEIMSHILLSLLFYTTICSKELGSITIALQNEVDTIFIEFTPNRLYDENADDLDAINEALMSDSAFKLDQSEIETVTIDFCTMALNALGGKLERDVDGDKLYSMSVRLPRKYPY